LLEKGVKITNDGISIAREVQLEDEIQDLALRKAREASVRANEQAGDGSTTTILLTHKVLEAVSQETGTGIIQKRPTADVIRQISQEKNEVIERLKESATPITSKEELIRSAVVSLEDEELGELIGSAQWDLGPEGVLIADKSNDTKVSIERVSGIRIGTEGAGNSIGKCLHASPDALSCFFAVPDNFIEVHLRLLLRVGSL